MEHFLFPAHVTMVLPSLQAHMAKIYTNMNAFTLHVYCEEKKNQLDQENRSLLCINNMHTNPKNKLKSTFGEVF